MSAYPEGFWDWPEAKQNAFFKAEADAFEVQEKAKATGDGVAGQPKTRSNGHDGRTQKARRKSDEQKTPSHVIGAGTFLRSYVPISYSLLGILPSGYLYGITAKQGSGKTAFMIAATLAVETGREDILGCRVESGRVAYVTIENPTDFKMKLAANCYLHNISYDEIEPRVAIIDGRDTPEQILEGLRLDAEENGDFQLVCFDTFQAGFAAAGAGAFNDNEATLGYTARLRPLTTLPGFPSVLVAFHPTKNASESELIPYGGGSTYNEIDGNLTLWKEAQIRLHHNRLRGPEFEPRYFRIEMSSCPFAGGGGTKKSPEEIKKSISHLTDLMVKTSQVSGLHAEDLAQYVKFGLPSANAAGVGLPFFLAAGATMKRAGLPGEEAGVAARAFVGAMLHPTAGARHVFDALGVHCADFAKAGPMSAENLSATVQRRLGRTLTPAELAAVNAVIANPELAGEQGAFTPAITKALGGENLKPNDAKQLSKVIGDFWTSSLANIDVEGLLKSVIAHQPSAAQDVAMMGTRQGGRFATLASHADDLREFEQKIAGTREGLASEQAAIQMGGFSGAKMRLEGAWRNVLTILYRDNEKWMTPLYNAGGKLETRFVEASDQTRSFTEAAVGAVAAIGIFAASLKALSLLGILPKGAAGAVFGGAASTIFGPAMVAGMLAAPTPLNVGEDEIARQRKYNQGPFRWLGNAPPEAGTFTPFQGGLGAAKLEGQADINLKIEVTNDPDTVVKKVEQSISARGALRSDTGVSMPQSMMPY